MAEFNDFELEEELTPPLTEDHELVPVIEAVRAESRITRNLIRRIMSEIQSHIDADAKAIAGAVATIEAELSALRDQQVTSTFNFANIDSAVASLKAIAEPATTSASADSTGSATGADSSTASTDTSSAAAQSAGTADVAASVAATLYEHVGTGSIDSAAWTPATVKAADGTALYTFTGDTAPGQTNGAGADWSVYAGSTEPVDATSGLTGS